MCVAPQPEMSQEWSAMAPMEFPGGTYKYSNIDNFPGKMFMTKCASNNVIRTTYNPAAFLTELLHAYAGSDTMSATLFEIYPGGVREMHWHDVVEWAYVIKGTCRSDVLASPYTSAWQSLIHATARCSSSIVAATRTPLS